MQGTDVVPCVAAARPYGSYGLPPEYAKAYGSHLDAIGITVNGDVNVTVNNVNHIHLTNASGVTSVHTQHGKRGPKRHRRTGGNCGRKPKLLHFYETCGLSDHDKLTGMSEGDFVAETVDVLKYSVRESERCVCGIGRSVAGVAGGVGQIVKGTFKLFASMFK